MKKESKKSAGDNGGKNAVGKVTVKQIRVPDHRARYKVEVGKDGEKDTKD